MGVWEPAWGWQRSPRGAVLMGRLEKRFSIICGHFHRVRAVCKILAVISRNYGNENVRYVMNLRACEACEGLRRCNIDSTVGRHSMLLQNTLRLATTSWDLEIGHWRPLHIESEIFFFVFVILSYQNACNRCKNAENRTWSEFFITDESFGGSV